MSSPQGGIGAAEEAEEVPQQAEIAKIEEAEAELKRRKVEEEEGKERERDRAGAIATPGREEDTQ